MELRTDRLLLRSWRPSDAPQVLAACSDPDVARWTTVPSPYTAEHARVFVEETVPRRWADGSVLGFAVTQGDLVHGSVSLRPHGESATLGYWTAPGSRRQGFTAEAVRALTRWGVDALALERVRWEAHVGNWGSRAVAESCGFMVEGTLRRHLPQGGRLVDAWHGSLLASDDVVDRRPFGSWRDLPGDGLLLRRWREDDVAALVALQSDPQTARFVPVPSPYAADDARTWLSTTMPLQWADGVAASLAVEQDGDVVGLVVLIAGRAGVAEVGCGVSPHARGRGVAVRALQALLPWAAARGVVRLEARVDVQNAVSLRAAERAGFVREGVLRAGLRPVREGLPRTDGVLLARLL